MILCGKSPTQQNFTNRNAITNVWLIDLLAVPVMTVQRLSDSDIHGLQEVWISVLLLFLNVHLTDFPQKLSKVAAPDPFTSTSQSVKDGSRRVGENKLLSRPGSSKNRFQVSELWLSLDMHLSRKWFLAVSGQMQGL